METTTRVEIERPVGEDFAGTNDHVTGWSLTVVEDEVLDQRPGLVGSTFRIVTEERGRRMELQGPVTAREPPRRSAIHLAGPHFDIEADDAFEDIGGRTRVAQHSVVCGKGFVKLVFALFGRLMKRSGCDAQQAELQRLEAKCEARAA